MRAICWIAVALALGIVEDAWACSCVPHSPCGSFAATEAVFLGQVIDVRREGRMNVARIAVTRVWKGSVDPVVTVSNEADTSCSFAFPVGQRFLVYGTGSKGIFRTHMCAGGGPLRGDAPEPELPPPGGRVTGSVLSLDRAFASGADPTMPIAGARVWVEAGGNLLATRTDGNGRFTLDGVPPGVHSVHADVSPDLEAVTQVALRSPSDCGSVVIMPRPAGHITGSFAPGGGAPVDKVELYAVPVTHDWTQRDLSDSKRTTVGPSGDFAFDGVTPGRYLITVNLVSPPRVSQPFAPAYYPGVESPQEAMVIDVGNDRVSLSQPFAPQRTLPRTKIQAEIVCRDGSLPRSGLVYAKQVDDRAYFHESTYERDDGRFRVTVMQGVSYDVEGEVLVPARDASGREIGFTGRRTPAVRVEPDGLTSVVRLVVPLDRCQDSTLDGSKPQ